MKKFLFYFLACAVPFALAADYWKGEDYFHNSSSQKEAASDLMKYVPIRGNEDILDVGCGDGKITAEIAKCLPNGTILGIDISPSMINFAKNSFQLSNVHFELKDAEKLDYQNLFDIVFSFTTLQWVQNHDAFIKGAHNSLKPFGTLAITMPLGLPLLLEKTVNEQIALPEWQPYFQDFSTGWNFVQQEEMARLLDKNGFDVTRITVVPQKDIFPNREIFEGFISQWFPYLRPLPESLKKIFMTQLINRFLELEVPSDQGEVYFKILRLEVVAHRS